MLRFIHASNINIGKTFPSLNKSLSEEASKIIEQCFLRLIKDSREKNIDALIISGNLFNSNCPDEKSINYVMDMFKSIPEIKVFIIPGEFDYLILRMLQKKAVTPQNVYIFNNYLESYKIKSNIMIYGIGHNPLFSGKNIKSIINQKLDNHMINILCFYGEEEFENICTGTESEVEDKNIAYGIDRGSITFKKNDIGAMGFDYIAVGKYTNYKKLLCIGNTLMAASSGELVATSSYLTQNRIDNSGTGNRGGYIYIEIDKNRSNYSFETTDINIFNEIRVNIENCRDNFGIVEKIRQEIKQQGLYIVILEGEIDVNFYIDEEDIINDINNERIIKIIDNTSYKQGDSIPEIYNSAREIFIKSVISKLQSNDRNSDFFKHVIKYGLSALKKDEGRIKA